MRAAGGSNVYFRAEAGQKGVELHKSNGTAGGTVGIEDTVATETVAELQRRGHPLQVAGGWERISFGRGQIIRRAPDGLLWGGSDPRADGCAMSLP